MAQKQLLQQQLRDIGSKLEIPPASKDVLLKFLKQAANYLSEIEQSPPSSVLDSMKPCLNAISRQDLLKHQDRDVKLLVATCICEITRITAPEAPYNDDVLKDIFHLIVSTFSGLDDVESLSFGRRVVILDTLARYRSCVMMLDLGCNDLINEMFKNFFSVISDNHQENVVMSMQTIMVLIVEESEEVHENLLCTLLSVLGRKRKDLSAAARKLAKNVIQLCVEKLEHSIKQFLIKSLSGDNSYLDASIDHHEVIYDIYQIAPQIISEIIPYITGELLTDKLDVRLNAVQLLGDLFSLPGSSISQPFQPLFSEFLKRMTDRAVVVRICVIEHVKNSLLANPSRPEAPQMIKALCDRLLDYDETVRKQVVGAVCDLACHSSMVIPGETARQVGERLRDKSISVKRYTMERLAELYRNHCSRDSEISASPGAFGWILGKILRCLYDKDFRLESIELILCSMFPLEFSVKTRVKHWLTVFPELEKVELKALEQILAQKQRLQQEMHKYLSLKQTVQDDDASELQKRISGCFRTMSRLFNDPLKTEESLQMLNQLKDTNIWKMLTSLLDPCTSFRQAWTIREDLLKILGERHPLYEFMDMLTVRCSYLLFNREHIMEILSMASSELPNGDTKLIESCMNLLAIIACFCPQLLAGSEEDLVQLLKEDNESIKEGIAHVLAKSGGTIREKLIMASSSVDLLLERLCIEGTRKQAKFAVHALASITKDEGLKSLSVLYKRIVDTLGEKTNLPAILQSLACIAQTATPVFETREDEVVQFIMKKILERCNETGESSHKADWSERTELCELKIYGLKTLVKSYLPIRDAQLRPGIEKLMEILKSILTFGDISIDTQSSIVDKAHMRLAAAKAILRLSRQWDHKIPIDVFYMTLSVSEDIYPESRKLFLSKLQLYIKERLLDAKYACAFLFNIDDRGSPEFEEAKHSLCELIQICRQMKARQHSFQGDISALITYPEYILAYLVHALAHHPMCPEIDERRNFQAFEPIHRRVKLFLSLLLLGDEGLPSNQNKKKESFNTIISILNGIKSSEDVVDQTKTKLSHAITDLALSIVKRLVTDQTETSSTIAISLPGTLYRPLQQTSDSSSVNSIQTWLCDANALAHFEALDNTDKDMEDSVNGINDVNAEERHNDDNELPLRKLMKMLKSQGAKKKNVRGDSLAFNTRTSENDIDVLGMVREINLDNSERCQDVQLYNLVKKNDDNGRNKSGDALLLKTKNPKDNNGVTLATPKRKRSSIQKPISGRIKDSRQRKKSDMLHSAVLDDTRVTELADDTMLESLNCNSLITSVSTRKTSGSNKKKREKSPFGQVIRNESRTPAIQLEMDKGSGHSKGSPGSMKSRKRKSIAGISKCSSEKQAEKLIGSRIKVWWPLDKQFYEGIIQSYEPGKKKHMVLYDDGDLEVLSLEKEKWELISDVGPPKKKPKTRDHSVEREKSRRISKQETGSSSKGKRSLKKNLKRKNGSKKELDVANSDLQNLRRDSRSGIDDNVTESSEDKPGQSNSPTNGQNGAFSSEKLGGSTQEGSISSGSDGKEDSDDEPLSTWKVQSTKNGRGC